MTSVIGSRTKFKLCSITTSKRRLPSSIRPKTGWSTGELTLTRSSQDPWRTLSTPTSSTATKASRHPSETWALRPARSGAKCMRRILRLHLEDSHSAVLRKLKNAARNSQAHSHRRAQTNTARRRTTRFKTRKMVSSPRAHLPLGCTQPSAESTHRAIMRRGCPT